MEKKNKGINNKAPIILALLFFICAPVFAQKNDSDVGYLCEQGKTYYSQGKMDDALSEFKKVLMVDHANKVAIDYIGKIFLQGNSTFGEATSVSDKEQLPLGKTLAVKTTAPLNQDNNISNRDKAMDKALDKAQDKTVKVQISAYGSNKKSQRGLFTTDFIIPLYYPQDKDTLVFYNPKYTYTTPDADEVNQGIGIRHIFNDSFILGINTFFDRRLAHSGKWYSQAGLGLEYLSRPLDVRLNWYKPLTRPKIVDDGYEFSSTSLAYFQKKEEPLQGLDFEIGVPVFDQYTKTRLYLGGFFYQSRLSKDVNGFRARSETSLTNWFSLDTTFNSQADVQTEFYGGVRVILPFEWTKIFRKKNKQESLVVTANSYLENRIFDRVVRDIDIQSKTSTSQSKVHDMVYVDNSNTGVQDGSFQHPYATIQQGVNNAFGDKWVYVRQGLSQDPAPTYYASDITLFNHDSVVLWGSGYSGGFKGLSVSGIYPVINGGTNGITLGNANTVMGLQIQNASHDGIIFTDETTLTGTIKHNNISNNYYCGIDLMGNFGTMSDFTISNNIFNNTIYVDGICLQNNFGTMSDFIISNNTTNNNGINFTGDGINLAYNQGTMSGFSIFNNTSNNNGFNGINLSVNSGTMSDFTISNNTTNNNGANYTGDGMNLSGNAGTISDFTFSHNSATANYRNGIYFHTESYATMNSINLGNGVTGGYNSIYNNNQFLGGYYDIENNSGINNLSAEYNWWGPPPAPQSSQFGGDFSVDYTNPLSSNPN